MNLTLLWPKLFTTAFLAALCFSVYRLRRHPPVLYIAAVIAVLLLRDLAFSLTGVETILPASDLVIMTLYLLWLRQYTGNRRIDRLFLLPNGLALAATVVLTAMAALSLGPAVSGLPLYLSLILLADVLYLAIVLGLVSSFHRQGVEIILRVRFPLMAGLFLTQVVILMYGYSHPLIHSVLLPASYLLHALVLLNYNRLDREEERESVRFYSTNLESTFDFMENLGNAITARLDLNQVLQIIVSSAVQNIGADAGAILMVDPYEDNLQVKATHGIYPPLAPVPDIVRVRPASLKRYFAQTPIPVGETLLGETVRDGQPVFVRDARQDPRLEHNKKDDILFVSSVLAIPLVVSNRVLGVLSTLKRAENQFFDERDFLHLRTFADYASITINNIFTYLEVLEKREMEREVDIAATIQNKLLPGNLPELKNASLGVYNRPAKGVSGDYYDIIPLDADKVAMVVCDVAGKGIPAALVMVMIRSILHLIVSPERDAATVLQWINRGITGRIDMDHFATIGFLIYSQEKREIVYSNAAHLPMMLYRGRSGTLHKVDTAGLPIGIEKDTRYGQKRVRLERGDLVILCTDGIPEAMNGKGEQYTLQGLKRVIEKNAVLPAAELVKSIHDDLGRFVGNARQHDDQTLLVMSVN